MTSICIIEERRSTAYSRQRLVDIQLPIPNGEQGRYLDYPPIQPDEEKTFIQALLLLESSGVSPGALSDHFPSQGRLAAPVYVYAHQYG